MYKACLIYYFSAHGSSHQSTITDTAHGDTGRGIMIQVLATRLACNCGPERLGVRATYAFIDSPFPKEE
jgi:hypothetical protein